MREHQIVITLKPEQFAEVQRLAKLAGAKSMGMFVRQKLLTILAMDGLPQMPDRQPSLPDAKRIATDLRRLHAELRGFVAESLGNTYIGQMDDVDNPDVAAGQAFPGGGVPSAEQPDLGFNLLDEELNEEPLYDLGADAQPGEFDRSVDELEQIADRVFAISPRLGALDESAVPGDENAMPFAGAKDPLADLLDQPTTDLSSISNSQDDSDEAEEVQVNLHLPDKTKRTHRPAPPGISGGPPPRKRQ